MSTSLLLAPAIYKQGNGVLSLLGQEILPYGKKALIVTGHKSWQATESVIRDSLAGKSISFSVMHYGDYCTENGAINVANRVKLEQAEIVVGVGGGRCLDTAKYGADKAGVRCITVPTISTTCAAFVPLCVVYDDSGTSLSTISTKYSVAACMVDTGCMIKTNPVRMLAAGIADALAKEPELVFSLNASSNLDKSVFPCIGSNISQYTTKLYISKGKQAIADFGEKTNTPEIEDVVSTNIALTGMISCLVSGGKHLAIAHAFYDCTTALYKRQRLSFLHGELVGCAIPVQMYVNGCSIEQINEMTSFLSSIGIGTNLSSFDIAPTAENKEAIIDYICTRIGVEDFHIRDRINGGFDLICK
jgi:glycerol dehydrogenase